MCAWLRWCLCWMFSFILFFFVRKHVLISICIGTYISLKLFAWLFGCRIDISFIYFGLPVNLFYNFANVHKYVVWWFKRLSTFCLLATEITNIIPNLVILVVVTINHSSSHEPQCNRLSSPLHCVRKTNEEGYHSENSVIKITF